MVLHIELMFASLLAAVSVNATPHSPVQSRSSKKCWSVDIWKRSTNQWCTDNCLHIPPYCPEEFCKCEVTNEKKWPRRTNLMPFQGSCGVENKPVRPIPDWVLKSSLGGSITLPNQYPWMVLIGSVGCAGSLITDRHVLTGKHCLYDAKYVKVGFHDRTNSHYYQIVPVKNYVTHTGGDMAIIILERPVDLTDKTIGTVCLPDSAYQDYKGKKALALGWGWTPEGNGESVYLQQVGLTVANYDDKNRLYTEAAFTRDGVPYNVCYGDSGGPLIYNQDGRWTVIAATVSDACFVDRHGAYRYDGMWNKVTDHLDWIKRVISVI